MIQKKAKSKYLREVKLKSNPYLKKKMMRMWMHLLLQGDHVEDQPEILRKSYNHPRNRIQKIVRTIKNSSRKMLHYQPRPDRELFQQ
jgi:hypothetical protein